MLLLTSFFNIIVYDNITDSILWFDSFKKNTQLKQIFVLKYYIRIMIQTYNKLGILDSCPSAVYTWS